MSSESRVCRVGWHPCSFSGSAMQAVPSVAGRPLGGVAQRQTGVWGSPPQGPAPRPVRSPPFPSHTWSLERASLVSVPLRRGPTAPPSGTRWWSFCGTRGRHVPRAGPTPQLPWELRARSSARSRPGSLWATGGRFPRSREPAGRRALSVLGRHPRPSSPRPWGGLLGCFPLLSESKGGLRQLSLSRHLSGATRGGLHAVPHRHGVVRPHTERKSGQ